MRTGDSGGAQAGFALLALLLVVAVSGLALAAAAQVWSTTSRRDKEEDLLRIGQEFRQAIRSYASSSPGAQQFPTRLEDLVLDPRFPFVKRHLRRIYADPLTGKPEWGLVKNGDWIVGVHSLAEGTPLKTALDPALGVADEAQRYADWVFSYRADEGEGRRADDHDPPGSGHNNEPRPSSAQPPPPPNAQGNPDGD